MDKAYTDQKFMKYLQKYSICNVYLNIVLKIPPILDFSNNSTVWNFAKILLLLKCQQFGTQMTLCKEPYSYPTPPKDKHFSDKKCHDHKTV